MKLSFLLLVSMLLASQLFGQNSQLKPSKGFLAGISQTGDVSKLLEDSMGKKINDCYIEEDENTIDQDGRVFVTRRFDLEIITNELNLAERLKAELERRIKSSRFKIHQSQSYPTGFNIDYVSGSTVGTIDLRAILGNGKMMKSKGHTYQLFLVFHESRTKG